MKNIIVTICGCLLLMSCGPKNGNSTSDKSPKDSVDVQVVSDETLKDIQFLQGLWVHSEDSLATVTIKDQQWTFNYVDNPVTEDDIYQISFADQLPKGVVDTENTEKAKHLILTNKTDTMYYEVLALSSKELSLMHCTTGRMHLYIKK